MDNFKSDISNQDFPIAERISAKSIHMLRMKALFL